MKHQRACSFGESDSTLKETPLRLEALEAPATKDRLHSYPVDPVSSFFAVLRMLTLVPSDNRHFPQSATGYGRVQTATQPLARSEGKSRGARMARSRAKARGMIWST